VIVIVGIGAELKEPGGNVIVMLIGTGKGAPAGVVSLESLVENHPLHSVAAPVPDFHTPTKAPPVVPLSPYKLSEPVESGSPCVQSVLAVHA
jgi:hypothetical protein